jgi:hypothetical protein
VRTRENNSEFKNNANSGKLLRLALGSMVYKAKDNKLSSRMLKLMNDIKKFDGVSGRGLRTVAIGLGSVGGKQLLKGFDFNNNARLKNVLYAPYDLDTASGKLVITDFIAAEQLQFPEGATHVSFQTAVLALDFASEVSEVAYSNVENLAINLTVTSPTMTPSSVPTGTGVQLFLLMISFYQEVNGVQYSLKNEDYNVLHVMEVL